MPAGEYIEGLALFGTMLAACAGGALLLARRYFPRLEGAERLLAPALVTTLGILAVHLVPAMAGLLARGSVIVASGLWLVGCVWFSRGAAPAADPAAPGGVAEEAGGTSVVPSPAGEAEDVARGVQRLPELLARADVSARVLVGFSLGVVLALLLVSLRDNLTAAPLSVDLLNFHLPVVARWIETGSIWQIDVFLPDVSPGHYPQSGDVILLAAVLPWRNDWLAHLAVFPYWALTGVSVYALARRLRAPAPAATVAACLTLVVPALAIPALSAGLVDPVMLFGFATGACFLLRHRETGSRADLVLAGLGLGLAFGTKWYAVWAVAIVLAVWAGGSLLERRGAGAVARDGAVLCGLVALAGGIWMLRNLVESGNPVFPVEVSPLGLTIFDAPRDTVRESAGFTLLHYVGDAGVWSEFIWPQLRRLLAWPSILIAVAAFAATAYLTFRPSPRLRLRGRTGQEPLPRREILAVALCGIALLFAYLVTPYSAGGPEGYPFLVAADARYAVPALLAGAAAAAAVAPASRVLAVVLGIATPFALIDGARWSAGGGSEAASVDPLTWGGVIVVAVLAALAWPAFAARASAARTRIGSTRPALLAGAAAVALLLVAVAGRVVEDRYNDHRYTGADPALDEFAAAAAEGVDVGLAGLWDDAGISPVLPAFGPRYGNRVAYVGRDDGDVLRRYTTAPAFAAALERGGYDLLVIGRGRPEAPEVPELRWAEEAGYAPVAESDRLVLLARAP